MADLSEEKEERKFLEDYPQFGSKTRVLACELFAERFRQVNDIAQKELLHILAMESFFMQFETFVAFFRAILKRKSSSIIHELKKQINLQNFFLEISKKSEVDLLQELRIKFEQLPWVTDAEKGEINKKFSAIIKLLKDRNFSEALQIVMSIFPKIKHKFLLFREEEKIKIITSEQEKKKIDGYKQRNVEVFEETAPLSGDIDYLVDLNERLQAAIADLVAIRLIELQ